MRAFALTLLCSALTGTALADPAPAPPSARLIYSVDPDAAGCPTAEVFRAAVNARVGREAFGEPASVTVDVTIRRAGDGYVATVALPDAASGSPGTRELRSDVSCTELATAAALVASIAIDPAAPVRPAPPSPSPPPPSSPPPPPRTWRVLVGAGPRGVWGLTPDVTPALALSAAAATTGAALGLELTGFLSTDAAYAGGSVAIRPLKVSLLPCRIWQHWEGCAVGQLAFIRGAGTGFDANYTAWKVLAGAGARAGWGADVGPVRVRLSVESDVLLPRTTFLVGSAAVYTTQGVSLSGGLDVLVVF
jgi:hypothetical protein